MKFEVWNTIVHRTARTKHINQFLRNFLHTGKQCLDMTSCDLLDFLLWRNVICWAPIVIFHTFAKCCVLRYSSYVGTGYVFFSSTASHDLRIFTIAKIRSPNKEILHTRPTPTQPYALAAATLLRTVNIDMDTINNWAILDSGATSNFLTTGVHVTNIQPTQKPIVARCNLHTPARWICSTSQSWHALPTSSQAWHHTPWLVW